MKKLPGLKSQKKTVNSQVKSDVLQKKDFLPVLDSVMTFKSFLISHAIILTAGLIFLFGLYFILNQDNRKFDYSSYIPVTKPPLSFNLNITYPDDELLVFKKDLTFSGNTTVANSTIFLTISWDEQENYLGFETDSSGNFSKIITLAPGINQITINAFDKSGSLKSATRTIYYSEETL